MQQRTPCIFVITAISVRLESLELLQRWLNIIRLQRLQAELLVQEAVAKSLVVKYI